MARHDTRAWGLLSVVALSVGLAIGYRVRQQYLSAFFLEMVLCFLVPFIMGWMSTSFAILMPALLFNAGLAGRVSYLAITGERPPYGSEDLPRSMLQLTLVMVALAAMSLIGPGIRRAARRDDLNP